MTVEVVTIADVLHEWRRKAIWDRVAARTDTGDFVTVTDARKEVVGVTGMDGRHDWISRSRLYPVWWPEAQFGQDEPCICKGFLVVPKCPIHGSQDSSREAK